MNNNIFETPKFFISAGENILLADDKDYVSICDGSRKIDTCLTLKDFIKMSIDNLLKQCRPTT